MFYKKYWAKLSATESSDTEPSLQKISDKQSLITQSLEEGDEKSLIPPQESQVKPIPKWLKRLPNQLTLFRIFCIPLVLYFMLHGEPHSDNFIPTFWDYGAAIAFYVACVTDILDGWIARKFHVESLLGKLLDPLADKLLVVSALIILVDQHRIAAPLVVVLIVRDLGINAIRIAAMEENIIIQASWLGKTKTLLLDLGIGALMINGIVANVLPFRHIGLFLVYCALFVSVWSAAEYLWDYAKKSRMRFED